MISRNTLKPKAVKKLEGEIEKTKDGIVKEARRYQQLLRKESTVRARMLSSARWRAQPALLRPTVRAEVRGAWPPGAALAALTKTSTGASYSTRDG